MAAYSAFLFLKMISSVRIVNNEENRSKSKCIYITRKDYIWNIVQHFFNQFVVRSIKPKYLRSSAKFSCGFNLNFSSVCLDIASGMTFLTTKIS